MSNKNKVFSYYVPNDTEFKEITFFGLNAIIKKYLSRIIIKNKFNNYFPLEIKAIPEGTSVPTNNVLLTIKLTDERYFHLFAYMNLLINDVLLLSRKITQLLENKLLYERYFLLTNGNLDDNIGFIYYHTLRNNKMVIEGIIDNLRLLEDTYGSLANGYGYTVINGNHKIWLPCDIDKNLFDDILNKLYINNWSTENLILEPYTNLVEKMKNDPTSFGDRYSVNYKKENLMLIKDDNGNFDTVEYSEYNDNELKLVFDNGYLIEKEK